LFGHSGDEEVWQPGTKEMLDDMHLRKIDMADEIFVINVGGYIGESTRREIAYAQQKGKKVNFGYTSNRIILDRSSYDFGKPKWHLLDVLKVPSVYRGLRLVYYYDDGREYDVSEELKIEYYD